MGDRSFPRIGSYRMSYIKDMRVDPILFVPVFRADCSMNNCNGSCCQDGVLLDPIDKARILAHAELITKHLEPGMEHDPAKWFDGEVAADADFPSGTCEGTAATDRGCVFLDSRGLCSLQKAAMAEGMHKFALKPFYCVAYPITMDAGVLTLEDPDFTNRPSCCSAMQTGALTPFDVCREEFDFMLGDEGVAELERIKNSQSEDMV